MKVNKERKRVCNPKLSENPYPTQKQFKDDCNVNYIVKNALRGIPPRFQSRGANYGDFTNMPELGAAHEAVRLAKERFMELPAELRRELDNDPRNLAKMTTEQAIRFKLAKAKELEEPSTPPPSQPTPPSGKKGGAAKAAPKEPTPPASEDE